MVSSNPACFILPTHSSGRSSLDEISKSHPDFRGRVLLDEMDPLDGDFLLMRPAPAEFPLSPCEHGTWISVDKQLGHLAGRKPLSVSLDDVRHVLGLSFDREFTRPCERRTACFSCLQVRSPIRSHLFLAQMSHHAGGQDTFNKDILLQNELLSSRGTHRLED